MTAVLKASTDCFLMRQLCKDFQCLIVRACNKTALLYLFVLALTWKNFLGWNCLVPWRLLNRIQGGNQYSWWPETTLNIIVSRATFLLFSSVGHFISVRSFVTVPGVMLYSFLRKRAARLCTLSVSFICFWLCGSYAKHPYSSCGLTKAR